MLKLKIVSPEGTPFDGEVENVTVPGVLGPFEILNDHAPIISLLEQGKVLYTKDGAKHTVLIDGGFVEVLHNVVSLCVELTPSTKA